MQILNIAVYIAAENINIDSGVWAISASISASIADSTLFATISTSSRILRVLKQVLLVYMNINAGNVTQEIDCRN